ncbi:tetratricopeptide repeat-containing sensor histidine kinase [Mucilaginibacter yixingensis]|uniref:tetratricopeptide repeat-containing sensor histidine kinase n=1 Tax=Mucilaginibacter yixingensis TaxID=1295612 RepID=UPI0014750920|nr:tetratricopeptide repeat-containing sensor histidine kinase [Mucilaginibacter yixingensis]
MFDSVSHLYEQNRLKEGMHYLDSSVQNLSNLTVADRFRIYSIRHYYYSKTQQKPEKALAYADSMLLLIENTPEKSRYSTFYAEANFARGDALFDLERYTESYNSYYKGYLIGKNDFNNCTLSDYTYRMGMITYKQGNYKYAIKYFKQSFDQNQQCKGEFIMFYRQQEVLDNIALSYRNNKQLDSAEVYFHKALQFIDEGGAPYLEARKEVLNVAKAVIYGNMADVLSKQGHIAEAIDMLTKSIDVNIRKGNDNHDAELSEIRLGQLYLSQKDFGQLKSLLEKLRAQLESAPSADVDAGYNLLTGNYYKAINNQAAALPFVERYHQIKDSLTEDNRVLKANNVNERMADLEKQYQIVSLQNRQRIYVYASVIFICMSTIIILLIYRNWRRSNTENIMISALNEKITAQKTDLEKTLDELELSSQEKDRILRTVAHDLRNPLGGIASLTSAMIEDTDYTAEQVELLKIVKETAHDSLELINEILEATNSSNNELTKQPVDINSLLNNSVELMRFKAAEKNQKIMLQTLDTPEELMISREKIWRVISNLISNAIKFSPIGAVIKVEIARTNGGVCISVNDRGIGIPEESKSKIFNMFTDAKRPGTLGEKSFGLGLSICRQIIERHNGKIWFESNTADGTTFFIQLDKVDAPANLIYSKQ